MLSHRTVRSSCCANIMQVHAQKCLWHLYASYGMRTGLGIHQLPPYKKIRCFRIGFLVGAGGFGPPKSLTTDLQSAPFGHSGILPYSIFQLNGAGGRIRTPDLLITNQLLYLLSYTSLSCFLSRFWPLASALIYNNRCLLICQQDTLWHSSPFYLKLFP